jgi:FAD/FMN-containing dehydrogenase
MPPSELAAAVAGAGPRGVLARGMGRAYGDAAQNAGGRVLTMTGMAGVGALDAERGEITVDAGVSLEALARVTMPRRWFPAVVPGTRFVTVGGAIAADIHGKNHHLDGGFGRHVMALTLVTPDGAAREVADGVAFPNGMAITPDGGTLIVAESYAGRLTAFDIEADGSLSNRRVWAALGEGEAPDGICIDAEGAVWYGSVPKQHCVRVREGGEVLRTVELDRGCFACMLGGEDGTTLFMVANRWGDPESTERTGQVLTVQAPAPRAGRP